jgi:hypothetical protein
MLKWENQPPLERGQMFRHWGLKNNWGLTCNRWGYV